MTEIDLNTFSGHLRDQQVVGVTIADAHDPTDDRRGSVTDEKVVPKKEKSFRGAAQFLERLFQFLTPVQLAIDERAELRREAFAFQRRLKKEEDISSIFKDWFTVCNIIIKD